jgi:hypothetical protein
MAPLKLVEVCLPMIVPLVDLVDLAGYACSPMA